MSEYQFLVVTLLFLILSRLPRRKSSWPGWRVIQEQEAAHERERLAAYVARHGPRWITTLPPWKQALILSPLWGALVGLLAGHPVYRQF